LILKPFQYPWIRRDDDLIKTKRVAINISLLCGDENELDLVALGDIHAIGTWVVAVPRRRKNNDAPNGRAASYVRKNQFPA